MERQFRRRRASKAITTCEGWFFDNLDLLSMANLHGNCVTSSVWLTVWSQWRHFDLKERMLSWKFSGFYSQIFVFAPLLFSLSQVRVLMRKKLFLRRPPVETLKHMLNIRYTDTLLGGPSLQSEAVPPLSRCIFAAGLERERCEGDMTNELCSASLKKNVFVILVTEDERGRNQQWGSVI